MSETTTSVQSTPEIAPLRESLDTLAAQKHSAFAAKINGSIFGKERHHLQEQYDQAEHAYINAVRVDVLEQVDAIEFESIDQKIDHFELSINERLAQDREAQKNELISQGGKRAEFLTWYANLSKKQKLGATVGLAAGGAAAAALMSFAGAGAATAAAGIGAYRLARGYNMRASKLYENPKEQPTYTADREIFNDESIDRAMAFLRKDSQLTIERAEKIKKGAALGALGAVALGSSVQLILDETSMGDSIGEKVGQWTSKLSELFIPIAHATEASHILKIPDEVIEQQQEINDNLSGRNSGMYGQPEISAEPTIVEKIAEKPSVAGSFTVEKGHGYTHELMETVKETYGVELSKQEAWELHKELVRTAGTDYIDLLDSNGSDTYSLGTSRYDVGISDSGKAEWSDKAIKVLDDKFADDSTVAESVGETPIESNVSSHSTERNQGMISGNNDFEVQQDTSTAEQPVPHDTPHNQGMDPSGNDDMPVEANPETQPGTALQGLAEAQTALEQGTDGINWEDMKNDAYEMRGMLLARDIESINNDYSFQNTLEYIRKDIGNMTYPGTDVMIIEETGSDFTSQLMINDLPDGISEMPPKVIDVFDRYIDSLRTLAP